MSIDIDMEQFRAVYVTECRELLTDMEQKLLELEAGSRDEELLHAIFRCVHSIKGGAGAFGLSEIGAFSHAFEYFLDMLRTGQLQPGGEISELLFKGRDVLEFMVGAAEAGTAVPAGYGSDVLAAIEQINAGLRGEVGKAPTPLAKKETVTTETQFYRILFTPQPSLFLSGNEPMLLLRELSRLGPVRTQCLIDRVPPLASLAPLECHLRWEVEIETSAGEAAIRELFEFVEDVATIEITPLAGYDAPEAAPAGAVPEGATAAPGAAPAADKAAADKVAATIRVETAKIDRLVDMVGELIIAQGMLQAQAKAASAHHPDLLMAAEGLAQHTRELQEAVMAVRMQPVKSIFSRMPRMARDLAKRLGKNVRLEMLGESTEVDKTIIEQLADPLTHMIRNSIDHGIESPQSRRERGKPETGTVLLEAASRGGRIEITISDDGGGINRERVLSLAVEKGIVPAGAVPSPEEIDMLIFAPGFSTAKEVSDVSGRGVGMDVVRRNIEGIGGTVSITNRPGLGSSFVISLPLTLAILEGMTVRVGLEQYIIPIASIMETLRPAESAVTRLVSGGEVIHVRGEFIPLLYLGQHFQVPDALTRASQALVMLVEGGTGKFGLVVDELIGQQQVVIKSIEAHAGTISGISGATILGDGKVSLILDILALAREVRQAESYPHAA